MNVFSKTVAVVSVITLAFSLAVNASAVSTSAESSILIEADTGETVYEHNADERLPMASTTKIMTALVALSHRELSDPVTVSPFAVGVEGSSVYLTAGEKLTMGDLLYAMMLESANDAAAAIAIEVGGSVEGFAELMNSHALSLGCKNTHFTNPHGLDDDAHYTTARELAAITRAALENETFRKIVSTERHTIPMPEGGVRMLINHNRLLRENDSVIGVKTGFTKRSGRCLVSAAERDGVTVIAVTLSDPDDWRDHTSLLSFGLDSYVHYSLASDSSLSASVPVVGADGSAFVTAVNASPVALTVPSGTPEPTLTLSLDRFYFAPVKEGDLLGVAEWYYPDGTLAASVPMIAKSGVEKPENKTFFDKIKDIIINEKKG